MRTVKMDKAECLEIIKRNRETHEAEYKEADEAYPDKVKTFYREMHELAEADDFKAAGKKRERAYSELKRPECHLDDYDRAINMLEHHVEDRVELTEQEYAEFIEDDWDWRGEFEDQYLSNTGKFSQGGRRRRRRR